MRTFPVLSISLLAALVNVAYAAAPSASPSPAPSGAPGACLGKSLGMDCSYGDPKGREIEGSCTTMTPGKPLVCSPMKGTRGAHFNQSHGQTPGMHPVPGANSSSGSSQ